MTLIPLPREGESPVRVNNNWELRVKRAKTRRPRKKKTETINMEIVLLPSNNMRLFLMKVAPGDASADSDARIFSFFFALAVFSEFYWLGALANRLGLFPFFVWAFTSLSFLLFSLSSLLLLLFFPSSTHFPTHPPFRFFSSLSHQLCNAPAY